jgi:hypothetical protein
LDLIRFDSIGAVAAADKAAADKAAADKAAKEYPWKTLENAPQQ